MGRALAQGLGNVLAGEQLQELSVARRGLFEAADSSCAVDRRTLLSCCNGGVRDHVCVCVRARMCAHTHLRTRVRAGGRVRMCEIESVRERERESSRAPTHCGGCARHPVARRRRRRRATC